MKSEWELEESRSLSHACAAGGRSRAPSPARRGLSRNAGEAGKHWLRPRHPDPTPAPTVHSIAKSRGRSFALDRGGSERVGFACPSGVEVSCAERDPGFLGFARDDTRMFRPLVARAGSSRINPQAGTPVPLVFSGLRDDAKNSAPARRSIASRRSFDSGSLRSR
jgi:hypothetical protein